ncbi:MAG: A/G-specific adenine glycosylase [Flavipsychrobacter sp.]|nr:A/G-specific adenine glycosylase [Flavipsychrobacter sp.]
MEFSKANKKYFTTHLTDWHATINNRSLPWKREKDPYKIWLSEVILQQTRSLQGLPYYLRFTETFPTVGAMAAAEDEQAFRLWQGLGYYNRCKNMLATARYIASELGGVFPDTYGGLLELKGIGPYTAAAIASFAYGRPNAVVDGNVYRVLSRYFGIDTPFDITEGKKLFATLAQELLDTKDSSAYNQAIMDLGATVCSPRKPLCGQCPLQKHCVAYHQGLIELLPVKSKKLVVRKRYFHYLVLKWQDEVWIHRRGAGDIWENLHEPYLIEHDTPLELKQLLKTEQFKALGLQYNTVKDVESGKQRLTHQLIESRFFVVDLLKKPVVDIPDSAWRSAIEVGKVGFPKTVLSFLENNLYF